MGEPQVSEIARIENVPLRVSVADIIRQAIINGSMRPGTPVVEMALAGAQNGAVRVDNRIRVGSS